MPATAISSEPPSVPLSFSNNFWGKDDAGVAPLLDRMHHAKVTCDELKSFYAARAAIEEEYARKMLSLAKRPLGSGETGTLKLSLDVVRQEVESMGKEHQKVAMKMRADLEEPLNAFAGHIKERRKIVQGPIEKLLKIKAQQTAVANKYRDRYESESHKIKGYLAQGHMVLGSEERKINAKLEKTKIQISSTSNEYENSIKALEETTLRWNRDWKLACDTFQDLEEGRIEFTKSSLWAFTNITSTVCVTDDASWERIRLSLEDCEVAKDIVSFINARGTGQDIPDPPKFKDFCRGDVNDSGSDPDEEPSYQTAQFPRPINPAHRTGASSPQPSSYEPTESVSGAGWDVTNSSPMTTPQKSSPGDVKSRQGSNSTHAMYGQKKHSSSWTDTPEDTHSDYAPDGMNNSFRGGPPSTVAPSSFVPSELSAQSARPSSRDSDSDYSDGGYDNSSFSKKPSSAKAPPPPKPTIEPDPMPGPTHTHQNTPSKKSRFWSPFRKPSRGENVLTKQSNHSSADVSNRSGNRNTWGASAAKAAGFGSSGRSNQRGSVFGGNRSVSPEPPLEPGAKFQLNVANNVFDVDPSTAREHSKSTSHLPQRGGPPDRHPSHSNAAETAGPTANDPFDPVAQALEDLNRVTSVSKMTKPRDPADKYYDIPSPGTVPTPLAANASPVHAAQRGTPPPSYDSPGSRLGAPPPAHTKSQMMAAQNRYVNQRKKMFESPTGRGEDKPPGSHHSRTQGHVPTGSNNIRAASPQPGARPASRAGGSGSYRPPSSQGYHNSASDTYGANNTPRARSNTTAQPNHGGYQPPSRAGASSSAGFSSPHSRPPSARPGTASEQHGMGMNMAVQLHQPGADYSQSRNRSRSNVGGGYTNDGKSILHHARAQYSYCPQIPEELGFAKHDILAVLRTQDDGWWEAQIVSSDKGGIGESGLVPSNYLIRVDGPGR